MIRACITLAVLITAGCGYHLRSTTDIPAALQKITFESNDPYGPMARALREQLRLNNITIVDDAARSDLASLRLLSVTESQDTVSVFADGKTAEYQLAMTLNTQVLIPGEDLTPLSITLFRSFFDNPLTALAKSAEQDILRQEMREHAAQLLVRKLISVQHTQKTSRPPAVQSDKTIAPAPTPPVSPSLP